jgi:hypothetical protein
LIQLQSTAKERIEKVFTAQSNREGFVRLARKQRPVFTSRNFHRFVSNILGRASREETIRDTKLDLVRVGDRVGVVENE